LLGTTDTGNVDLVAFSVIAAEVHAVQRLNSEM